VQQRFEGGHGGMTPQREGKGGVDIGWRDGDARLQRQVYRETKVTARKREGFKSI
jgi:hypothetical protein